MTQLGRQDGDVLTVDLRGIQIESWDELWTALAEPCGLPNWFGRNLDAWWDTIEAGAISDVLDAHRALVVVVMGTGIFAPDGDLEAFIEVTNSSRYASVEIHSPE